MADEKRRFFRINEHIGLTFERLDQAPAKPPAALPEGHVQDKQLEQLLLEVAQESPKMAALVTALNAKLERVLQQLTLESRMVTQLASRMREVNISACGLGFWCDQDAAPGTHLRLELAFSPEERKLQIKGIVIASEKGTHGFYWRVDFYGMSQSTQESLIRHIVQRQSVQLKLLRGF